MKQLDLSIELQNKCSTIYTIYKLKSHLISKWIVNPIIPVEDLYNEL